ncbi:hypothetical protein C8R44DRAFT_822430 [Mycena epipterygia]|nr:hypothetical protein C8R44DRAFT_822430 [Mycena epipterygia]
MEGSSEELDFDADYGDLEDSDSAQEKGSGDESSNYEGSISSYSDSERPDQKAFDPMPEHLVLPLELQRLVLSLETSQPQVLWGTYRFVCKAWKEHVEHIARTQWVRKSAFYYRGYMTRDAEENKVFLNGDFTFQRMDGDNAIFATDCVVKYRRMLAKACKATSPPDVEVCEFVHDVKIPGMVADWEALTIACPWRALVGRVLTEELRVDAYRVNTNKAMMTKVKRMRGGLENLRAIMSLFAAHVHGAYEAVRKARLGYTDKRGDERLKEARAAVSWRLREEEDDDGAEESEAGEESE